MKKRPLLLLLFLLLLSAHLPAQNEGFAFSKRSDEITSRYLLPVRLLPLPAAHNGGVKDGLLLLNDFTGQLTTRADSLCILSTEDGKKAALLLDFGRELHGGIAIAAGIREQKKPVRVRIRFGESVSEAMSETGGNTPDSSATNDHALRDFTLEIPWLGTIETGNSGFRFVRIDLLDEETTLPLRAVQAVLKYRDIPYLGSFRCSDERLDRIWETGAYTVHLNMQDYLWDGIKRDRLVWLGDMHPEVMTVHAVFGVQEVVKKSLDFGRETTPLPGWMNGMCSYSLWWIITQRDLYLYGGDRAYLEKQRDYLKALLAQVTALIEGNRETLRGGTRFLDWPTSENPAAIHAGLQAMMILATEAGAQLGQWLGDAGMEKMCTEALQSLRKYLPPHENNKQAAAMLALAYPEKMAAESSRVILRDGAHGFSTFYGYYMLEALARGGHYAEALRIISDYWGGMLDLGATTFWEDFDLEWLENAGRIDEMPLPGKTDVHAAYGDYCYVGLRHSLCHGWASGPTAWLSQHVLGITPLEAGCRTVRIAPHLGDLAWAEGTFPTPYGTIRVRHEKTPGGEILSRIDAPDEIVIIR